MADTPLRVVITGGAGQISYSLIPQIASGLFGPQRKIDLVLLEIPPGRDAMAGVGMEIMDCAFPLIHSLTESVDPVEAFTGCDVAILVGGFPRRQGMLRKDLIAKNAPIFGGMGKAIDENAKADCKVLVVANPANTNALLAARQFKRIPLKNISALTRLDHNRARAQIAARASVPVSDVKNVIIWGNHSATQYPDVNHAYIQGIQDGSRTTVRQAVNDDAWIDGEFISTVQKRGAAIIAARKLSSAMSAAKAICDHLRTWLVDGTPDGEYTSMAVYSNGEYGTAPGVMFSFPCTCANGDYEIVQGLAWTPLAEEKIKASNEELVQERQTAMTIVGAGRM